MLKIVPIMPKIMNLPIMPQLCPLPSIMVGVQIFDTVQKKW